MHGGGSVAREMLYGSDGKKLFVRLDAAANGQLDHPSRIFLVDTQYRIREIYNLNFLKPKWVAQDIELLLQE